MNQLPRKEYSICNIFPPDNWNYVVFAGKAQSESVVCMISGVVINDIRFAGVK